jgi:hypothetical protein
MKDARSLAFGPGGVFGYNLYVADPNLCDRTSSCDPALGADGNDGAIYRVDPTGNVTLFVGGPASDLEDPLDLAFSSGDSFGTLLYVTDRGTGKVVRIDSSGAISDFATGLVLPGALAFGPSG